MIGSSRLRAAKMLSFVTGTAGSMAVAAAEVAALEPVGGWEILRVGGSLLVVVAVIVATAAGLKRLKSLHGVSGSHMKIVDGLSVSTRDRIVLLEVGDERILVGVSPGRIQALHVCAAVRNTQPRFTEIVDRAAADLHAAEASQ